MDDGLVLVAERCVRGAEDGTMDFPQIVGVLMGAGFESYAVDFRRGTATYYQADGDSVELAVGRKEGAVAAGFDAGVVQGAIRAAQAGAAGSLLRADGGDLGGDVSGVGGLGGRAWGGGFSVEHGGTEDTEEARRSGAGAGALEAGRRETYGCGLCDEGGMNGRRRVRLFRNGLNQAVRIPVAFELPGDEAIMRREGDRLVIEPVRQRRLVALLATMTPINEPSPEIDDPVLASERIF
jgi:antitoxin VapB